MSVVLCTHNPRPDYFRRVLDTLRAQNLSLDQWELLIIDNASTERVADKWDISWHTRGRHVREDEVGLTPARLRGIKDSSGQLLVFVDDDNLLSPDYLKQAAAIVVQHSNLGVFGAGILEPEFEAQPPPELIPRLRMLAIRNASSALWSNNPTDAACLPCGAGLCVTRRIADAYRQLVAKLSVTGVLDRRGQQLFSGGDDVFSWTAAMAGQGFGVFPELRITHLISAGRLNQRYFVRLMHDHTFSHGVLRYLLAGAPQRCIGLTRYIHLLLHGIRNGWFSMQCQWAESKGEDSACRYISDNRLRPVELGDIANSTAISG